MSCKNQKVIYTCITGDYDKLLEVQKKDEGFDYICFTDNPSLESDTWEIRLIDGLEHLNNVRKQRYIKINTHKFLSEYDLSIWVDGNIQVLGKFNELIEKHHSGYMTTFKHPWNHCIYQECRGCAIVKKDDPFVMLKQTMGYMKEGYPKDNGLVETKMIIRYHNETKCIELMEGWWNELDKGSHRDQLSFNYVLWKQNKTINIIEEKYVHNINIFIVYGHGDKAVPWEYMVRGRI